MRLAHESLSKPETSILKWDGYNLIPAIIMLIPVTNQDVGF
jgi:hypothetical protein